MRQILLLGSFDPIHCGHLSLIEYLQKTYPMDSIVVLSSYKHHHKEKAQASVQHRLAMLNLALKDSAVILDSYALVNRLSWNLLQAVRYLKKEYTFPSEAFEYGQVEDLQVVVVLGDDLYESFPAWKDAKTLLQEAQFLIAHRLYAHKLPLVPHFTYLDNSLFPVSSRLIREKVQEGQSLKNLVPQALEDYIHDQRIYIK